MWQFLVVTSRDTYKNPIKIKTFFLLPTNHMTCGSHEEVSIETETCLVTQGVNATVQRHQVLLTTWTQDYMYINVRVQRDSGNQNCRQNHLALSLA
jgi:hypothetical protein